MFGFYSEFVCFAGIDSQFVWLGFAFAEVYLYLASLNLLRFIFEKFPKIESFFVGTDLSEVDIGPDCLIALFYLSGAHSELTLLEWALTEFSATEATLFGIL